VQLVMQLFVHGNQQLGRPTWQRIYVKLASVTPAETSEDSTASRTLESFPLASKAGLEASARSDLGPSRGDLSEQTHGRAGYFAT
jgi:hypothetical protein